MTCRARRRGGGLQSSNLLAADPLADAEQDPMSSMGNLMDVMLVFACGLIIALIATYNVDLTSDPSSNMDSATELEGEVEDIAEDVALDAGNYTELGMAYRDEETGQLYIVESD